MNWDYTGTKSYVDTIPPTHLYTPNPAFEGPPVWSAAQADARLKPGVLRQPCSSEQLGSSSQQFGQFPVPGRCPTEVNTVLPSHRVPLLRTSSLPPVDPSKQLASTPEIPPSIRSPASSQNTPAITQSPFSPPSTAPFPGQQASFVAINNNMADPRKLSSQHHPMMGPPETPSRVMQASPNMFPTLQFSPDLFSAQSMGPASAPAYPQRGLFWDHTVPHPENHSNGQFHNAYAESFDTSFHSSSTVVPNYSPAVSQASTFDLPQQPPPAGPFLDSNAFPMPFQTSPRHPPPAIENPTLFLSSPARRFGGAEATTTSSYARPAREVPAYHHQIEESRRERELERRRTKSAAKRADADLIMSSVRRALSPSKLVRPGLKRSQTYSGISTQQQNPRRPSGMSFNDSASTSSMASAGSSRNGRSSPLKSMRQVSSSSVSKARASQKPRTAMTLAIDENGVAKTVLQELPELHDDMDIDDDSQSVISSADDGDFEMLRSQAASFAVDADDTSLDLSQTSLNALDRLPGMDHSVSASRLAQDPRGGVGSLNGKVAKRGQVQVETYNQVSTSKGDAQKALRAIIEDRSRSVSARGGYSSSRQSDSSVQFHSSPPVQQNQFGDFNASPTTITDPDLATPSTDQEGFGGMGMTRCVCNSVSPDGSAMIQCDSCSKWLHAQCVGIDKRRISDAYICVYCEQTPVRHLANRGSVRSTMRGNANSASPLAHKSIRPSRGRRFE